jgi:hypothetical protein
MEGRLEKLRVWDTLHPPDFEALRALLLDYQERGREIEKLHAAISWLDEPFIDESTSESELRTRIALMLADRDRANLKGKSHE